MHWLAIIIVTTTVGNTQYMVRIPASTEVACEAAVVKWEADYVKGDFASASDFYECVDIGSIVKGVKP